MNLKLYRMKYLKKYTYEIIFLILVFTIIITNR
jgi:hypothetical protein